MVLSIQKRVSAPKNGCRLAAQIHSAPPYCPKACAGARRWFTGFDYGRANLDAADQTERLSTNAIGVSDHDGYVLRLVIDRIFADSFGGD